MRRTGGKGTVGNGPNADENGRSRGRPEAPLQLDRFLPYRFSILAKRLSDTLARDYAERFGLTIPEWRVMAVLGPDGELSASGVCERTLMDKVTVSRAVARLVDRGRLERRTDPIDRRRTKLRLTAAGRAVYRKIVPLARHYEARLLDGLSLREQKTLDRLLAKLADRVAAIDAHQVDGGGPNDS